MRMKLAVVAASVGALLAAAPALAHHAFAAEFDINKPIQLRGTLLKWEMINPHSWFHLDVKDSDGKIVSWMIEGGSPNQLIRMGVTKNTVQVGTEIVVEGYQAKDASKTAVGRNFVLPDGKRLFVGSPGGPDSPPASAVKP